ncbi:MAG: hypothetical protein WA885_06740 [Phormidesmis sp.]
MDRIQTQASELWDLLFSKETAATYQKAFDLTGTLLKETAQLLWLIVCSFFVFGAWVADTSVKTGKSVRDWIDNKGVEPTVPGDKKAIADTGKSLLDKGRVSLANLLNQAREQLGLETVEISALTPAKSAPASPPAKSVSDSAPVSTSAPSAANPATEVPTATTEVPTATEVSTEIPSTSSSSTSSSSTSSSSAATERPATSAGQEIGSSYAASRGSGSISGSMQSSSPQATRYTKDEKALEEEESDGLSTDGEDE